MADTGAPGFLPLVSGSDQFAPPQAPINALATALNTALGKTAFNTYDTKAHLDAAPGTVNGQHATVNADPNTALNGDYVWNGSAWGTTSATGAIAYTGIYSAGPTAPTVVKQGGRVYLNGTVISPSATFAVGNTYTIGSLPANPNLAPAADEIFACLANISATAWVTVKANGTITFSVGVTYTGALNLTLTPCNWKK